MARSFYEQVVFEMSEELTTARKRGEKPKGNPYMQEQLSPEQIRTRFARGGPGEKREIIKKQGLERVMTALSPTEAQAGHNSERLTHNGTNPGIPGPSET